MATVVKTDAGIQQDVLDELDWDPQLEPNEVGVEVDDGVVTLTGTVDTYTKKSAAERAALRVQGVRAVANGLTYHTEWSKANDTDIARAAASAIESHVYGDVNEIDVTVANGIVTMTGRVPWAYQRSAAENAVRFLKGVRDIDNQITIVQPKVSASAVESNIERALIRSAELDANRIRVHVENSHVRLTGTVSSWSEKRAAENAAWRAKGVTQVDNDLMVASF
jgi:osmotically-inducible protein OsmY